MDTFLDNVLGWQDFLDCAGLWKLSVINGNLLTGTFSYFRLHWFLKIITFPAFIVMLAVSLFLMVGCFCLAVLSFIPFQLGRLGNACLNLALAISKPDGIDNFFLSLLMSILIYAVCIVALICLIVPKILLTNPEAT